MRILFILIPKFLGTPFKFCTWAECLLHHAIVESFFSVSFCLPPQPAPTASSHQTCSSSCHQILGGLSARRRECGLNQLGLTLLGAGSEGISPTIPQAHEDGTCSLYP